MKKTYELEIKQDFDPRNPREDDNLTTMVCFHNRYDIGDEHNYKSSDFNSWEEMKEQIESDYNLLAIKPLYMYDHSGITISTSPFGCQWDSGQIGWVFIHEKQMEYICGKDFDRTEEKLDEMIEGEVETYDKFITGEVYGYEVYEVETCDKGHEHKTLAESCWGFYSEQDAEDEGNSVLQHLEKELELG